MRDVASYGVMRHDTAGAIIANIYADLDDGDSLTLAFQGGEPLIAGLEFFRAFADEAGKQVVKVKLNWAVQTNGTLINEDWCAFFKAHNFLVGLSLDGDASLHNQNRRLADGGASFNRVLRAKRMLEAFHVEYNVLCVLTNESARHPRKLWKFILEENIRYIQFIPCLGALSAAEKNPWILSPGRFCDFYSALFPLWQKQALSGNYVSVKLFDDIVNLFVRGQETACGLSGGCRPQFVVEANGDVYPCDFYVLDEYRIGNLAEMRISEVFDRAVSCGFLTSRSRLPESCGKCRYLSACNGGCKRMESVMYVNESGCCGYQAFLNERLDTLCQTGVALLKG
jgi:uncharacterized protein